MLSVYIPNHEFSKEGPEESGAIMKRIHADKKTALQLNISLSMCTGGTCLCRSPEGWLCPRHLGSPPVNRQVIIQNVVFFLSSLYIVIDIEDSVVGTGPTPNHPIAKMDNAPQNATLREGILRKGSEVANIAV